jgi:leucyl-tRNA synthetase
MGVSGAAKSTALSISLSSIWARWSGTPRTGATGSGKSTTLYAALNEIDAFLADDSPGAYEKVVDRLLGSPRYGERMAVDWLDVARYADTYGYQADVYREIHQLLKQANYDFAKYQFNTVASAAMKMLNVLSALPAAVPAKPGYLPSGDVYDKIIHDGLEILLKLLAPIVPHVTHALWRDLGYKGELLDAGWPEPDPRAFERDTVELVVQVNGKLRGRVSVPANADEDKAREIALADENVKRHVGDKAVRKVIHVPGKLINIVVAG